MNEIFPGEQCKNRAIFCNAPYILVMRHNIVDAPITHYDKINIIIIFRYAPDALCQINRYL